MKFTDRYTHCAIGKEGMVAAAHPLAVIAGLDALREGGNAMDACIAMAAATSVVLPHMCGLGGDVFFIYFEASTKKVFGLNASGPAGDLGTADYYLSRRDLISDTPVGPILPQDGIHSVAVPGAPLAYDVAMKRFGTFGIKKAFSPAVSIARNGFTVCPRYAAAVKAEKAKLLRNGEAAKVFLKGEEAPRPGSVFANPDLARSLEEYAEGGAEWFYKGEYARRFYECAEKLGSAHTGFEFGRFFEEGLEFYEPLYVNYKGYQVYETAPVTPGFVVLEELGILSHFDISSLDPSSGDAIHLMVQAKKLAYSDRNKYAGDPRFSSFNAREFIEPEYTGRLAKEIVASGEVSEALYRGRSGGDTTSFVAVDKWGNACSFIHSNAFSFGSGLVVPGTGFVLNNRAGRSFNLDPNHPNCIAPGKRPMHTLNAYMVLKGGEFYIAGGTPGGDGQPQWNMQMLSLMLDHGAGPQEACDFPRWTSSPGTDMLTLANPPEVRLEARFPAATQEALKQLGHNVKVVGDWAGGGGAQIIMRDDDGLLIGGSDRRIGGLALGW